MPARALTWQNKGRKPSSKIHFKTKTSRTFYAFYCACSGFFFSFLILLSRFGWIQKGHRSVARRCASFILLQPGIWIVEVNGVKAPPSCRLTIDTQPAIWLAPRGPRWAARTLIPAGILGATVMLHLSLVGIFPTWKASNSIIEPLWRFSLLQIFILIIFPVWKTQQFNVDWKTKRKNLVIILHLLFYVEGCPV